MRSYSQREKIISILCVSVILVYAGYRGVYGYYRRELHALRQKIATAEHQLNNTFQIIARGRFMNREYSRYAGPYQQKGTDAQVMSTVLNNVQQAAAASTVRISDIKPQRVKKEGFYNLFSVDLSLQGSVSELGRFFYHLQTEPHFFHIDEVRMDTHIREKGVVRCELVISKIFVPVS